MKQAFLHKPTASYLTDEFGMVIALPRSVIWRSRRVCERPYAITFR